MKFLITGGTGFVGSNFVYRLLELGHDIHLIVRTQSKFWRIEPIKKDLSLHYIDIQDPVSLEKLFFDLRPEIILNFAAFVGAYGIDPETDQSIQEAINVNLRGTINLINASAKVGFRCFINTGSSSEYGVKNSPIKEIDLLEPTSLYGITKASSTFYCQAIAKKLNLPLITMRLFSPYGYFDERKRIIPSTILAFFKKFRLNLVSRPIVRDFIFIDDIFDAYLKAIENINFIKGNIFNVGTGIQHSSSDVIKTVEEITSQKLDIHYDEKLLKKDEPQNWVADISKIKNFLKWEPKLSLTQGIEKTIRWFEVNQNLYI